MFKLNKYFGEIDKAIKEKNLNEVKLFLKDRDLNSKDYKIVRNNFIILQSLLESKSLEIVKFTLETFPKEYLNSEEMFILGILKTCDDNSFEIFKYVYDTIENTNEHIKDDIYEQISMYKGDYKQLFTFLINEKIININHIFQYNPRKSDLSTTTFLISAVRSNNYEVVKYVLDKIDYKLIDFQDQNGNTALHHAIGKNDIFQLLLRFGANPEIKNNENKTVKDILLDNYNNIKEHNLLLNQKYKEKLEKIDYLFNLFTNNQTTEVSKEEIEPILPNFDTLPGKTNLLLFENNFIDFDWINGIQGEVVIFIIANNKFNLESITKIKKILFGKKYLISLIIDENKTDLEYYQIERRSNILRNDYPSELKPYVNFLDYLELDEHINLDKINVQMQMKKKYNLTFDECEKILDNMMEEGLIYMPNEYSYARIK